MQQSKEKDQFFPSFSPGEKGGGGRHLLYTLLTYLSQSVLTFIFLKIFIFILKITQSENLEHRANIL